MPRALVVTLSIELNGFKDCDRNPTEGKHLPGGNSDEQGVEWNLCTEIQSRLLEERKKQEEQEDVLLLLHNHMKYTKFKFTTTDTTTDQDPEVVVAVRSPAPQLGTPNSPDYGIITMENEITEENWRNVQLSKTWRNGQCNVKMDIFPISERKSKLGDIFKQYPKIDFKTYEMKITAINGRSQQDIPVASPPAQNKITDARRNLQRPRTPTPIRRTPSRSRERGRAVR